MSTFLRRLVPAGALAAVVGIGLYFVASPETLTGDAAGAGCAGSTEAPPSTENLGEGSDEARDAVAKIKGMDDEVLLADAPSPELLDARRELLGHADEAVVVLADEILGEGVAEPATAEMLGLLGTIVSTHELEQAQLDTLFDLGFDLISQIPDTRDEMISSVAFQDALGDLGLENECQDACFRPKFKHGEVKVTAADVVEPIHTNTLVRTEDLPVRLDRPVSMSIPAKYRGMLDQAAFDDAIEHLAVDRVEVAAIGLLDAILTRGKNLDSVPANDAAYRARLIDIADRLRTTRLSARTAGLVLSLYDQRAPAEREWGEQIEYLVWDENMPVVAREAACYVATRRQVVPKPTAQDVIRSADSGVAACVAGAGLQSGDMSVADWAFDHPSRKVRLAALRGLTVESASTVFDRLVPRVLPSVEGMTIEPTRTAATPETEERPADVGTMPEGALASTQGPRTVGLSVKERALAARTLVGAAVKHPDQLDDLVESLTVAAADSPRGGAWASSVIEALGVPLPELTDDGPGIPPAVLAGDVTVDLDPPVIAPPSGPETAEDLPAAPTFADECDVVIQPDVAGTGVAQASHVLGRDSTLCFAPGTYKGTMLIREGGFRFVALEPGKTVLEGNLIIAAPTVVVGWNVQGLLAVAGEAAGSVLLANHFELGGLADSTDLLMVGNRTGEGASIQGALGLVNPELHLSPSSDFLQVGVKKANIVSGGNRGGALGWAKLELLSFPGLGHLWGLDDENTMGRAGWGFASDEQPGKWLQKGHAAAGPGFRAGTADFRWLPVYGPDADFVESRAIMVPYRPGPWWLDQEGAVFLLSREHGAKKAAAPQ